MFPTDPSAEDSWRVVLETFQSAEDQFERWGLARLIPSDCCEHVVEELRAQRREYATLSTQGTLAPIVSGIIPATLAETDDVQALRQWVFLQHKVRELSVPSRQLPLFHLHALEREVSERLSSISRQLSSQGIDVRRLESSCVVQAILVDDETEDADATSAKAASPDDIRSTPRFSPGAKEATAEESAEAKAKAFVTNTASKKTPAAAVASEPRRSWLELLLDPRSIQWLLGLGGALMVVGLVILLWINEFFTPPVMAVSLGLINIVVLAAGFSLIRWTRFQLAGKALSLLSCLVMPLNLWYYNANGLITLDGHLWVAAVIISVIYAASALLLKDEMFVYVFTGGVALTGLLILADVPPSPQKFWEIPLPATLLVVLGLIAIHVERAFANKDGPFSRDRFGLAFFWSGHVLMAAGLMLVLGAQVAGDLLYEAWYKPLFEARDAVPSPICGELRWLAFTLVSLATYAYVYSDLVVRKLGVYVHIAAFTLLWAEILAMKMLSLDLGVDAIIIVLALTSLVIHVVQANVPGNQKYTRSLPAFGLLLGLLPVLLGGLIYLQNVGWRTIWVDEPPSWSFVGAMLLTAVASRVGAYVYRHDSKSKTMSAFFFASGASVMVAAASALAAMGGERWEEHAPILMLIPIVYLVAARLYGERPQARSLRWVAHAAAVAMLGSSLASAFAGFTDESQVGRLGLVLFFAEAAVFYGLATWMQKQPLLVHLTTLMACGGVWQLLAYFTVGTQAYMLVFAVIGLLLLVAYRLSFWEKTAAAPLAQSFFQASNSLLSLAFISSFFHCLFGIIRSGIGGSGSIELDLGFVGFCVTMLIVSLVALSITQQDAWRRWYVVTTLAEAAITLLAVHQLIALSPWQQIELFAVLTGLLLLVLGHVGWHREQERENELVSTSLMFGALLASVPLAVATWNDRFHSEFLAINEFGFLFVSVLLLASGLVFRVKATTVVGGIMTALYFATLLIFVPWSQLNSVAIAITLGGGVLFGFGLILAFFRDRMLELPQRIRQRDGVFRVLSWR